jgi:glycosyltransferase involved in cell wall biosynthesis
MKVCLFTDTLGDVNGVSRFIRTAGDTAAAHGRDLTIITSTRLTMPAGAHFINFDPLYARRMPMYEHLEIAVPPWFAMGRAVAAMKPDAIHVSTPGPVGTAGRRIARKLGVPLLGTYHTDFPAYLEHLSHDSVLGAMTAGVMKWFYAPFDRIFSRSEEYIDAMVAVGLDRARMRRLRPGMDTTAFRPEFRDPAIWTRLGVDDRPGVVRVLSCGRVSVEKNLPLLTRAWIKARETLRGRGVEARLVVVGDGPYLAAMRAALGGADADFVGFRHGRELSTIYASCDLFAFPSETDTLGQVVMEAQASGLPALVSDIGGPKSIVVDGVTGRVIRGGGEAAWAAAMADLVADAERRRRMGAEGYRHLQGFGFLASFEHFWGEHEAAVGEHQRGAAPRIHHRDTETQRRA